MISNPDTNTLPADDRGPFVDLDRIRIDMLNERPPEPAESLFEDDKVGGQQVLARLRFFRWMLEELYNGSAYVWEASLERRDERLRVVRRAPAYPVRELVSAA